MTLRILLLLFMILSAVPAAFAADIDNQALANTEFAKGKKLYEAKKYKEAQPVLDKAADHGSRDTTIQYYLALAALQNADYEMFKRALARIIVHRHTKRGVGQQALQLLNRYYRDCQPFPCLSGATGNLARFVRKDMPIKIYITQGLMLPAEFRGREGIQPDKMMTLLQYFQQGMPFYQGLERDPGYNASMASAVAAGLQQWDWAKKENILDYQLVNSPVGADVLIFWCPNMERGHGAFTQAMSATGVGKKVYIEVSTVKQNTEYSKLMWTIAHEFGHCWGMSFHSTNPKDLMSANASADRPHGYISENDKLTLRALYDLAPTVRR